MRMIKKVETVEITKVVYTTGTGTHEDPVRIETQYWSKDGQLLAVGVSEELSL